MALSKASILRHAGDFTPREVHVPAWKDEQGDDVVLVRGMTIREFEINQSRASDGKATASLIARCAVDPTGGRLFDDSDVDRIAELPLDQVGELSRAIAELSGLSDDKDAVEKAITDAEGNSEPTTGDGTSSD